MMIFNHPDMVAGAAPACANFSGFQTDQLIADLKDKFTKEDRRLEPERLGIELHHRVQVPHRKRRRDLPQPCAHVASST
jgi:hypothetical protein